MDLSITSFHEPTFFTEIAGYLLIMSWLLFLTCASVCIPVFLSKTREYSRTNRALLQISIIVSVALLGFVVGFHIYGLASNDAYYTITADNIDETAILFGPSLVTIIIAGLLLRRTVPVQDDVLSIKRDEENSA